MSVVSRKVSSIVKRREYAFTISFASAVASDVARHHDSFMPFRLTSTTAGTGLRVRVTLASTIFRARPCAGTSSDAATASSSGPATMMFSRKRIT